MFTQAKLSRWFPFWCIERKYKDAKRLTDEIKTLTDEGESKQKEVLEIEQSLKANEEQMQLAHDQIERHHEEYDAKLKQFGMWLILHNKISPVLYHTDTSFGSVP